MTPTPEIIAATLKLPIEARRALAEQPGPGWWVRDDGALFGPDVEARERPPHASKQVMRSIRSGCAWLPANDTAWMEAATPGDCAWAVFPDEACIYYRWPGFGHGARWSADSAQLCALKRWGVL